MKEKPMLFSTPMVQAILRGDKTQTRRIVKNDGAKSPVEVGDVIWVKETFAVGSYRDDFPIYKADCTEQSLIEYPIKWKPSLFMPKCYSRISLKVTGVRIERLKEISKLEAIAEGIEVVESGYKDYSGRIAKYLEYPVNSYQTLWESINGKGTWNINPYVWVIEFKKI